ncbi:heavy metal transport/detoxification protein [Thermincola ferriacetica]|uniref:Heavy metal transport/detoxification protein n=1 Tax=Thermincola ferriacetica TaxID=281456 RepID=A0A0L6W5V9_9FIRM|nr:cation transporter [Thermincola ferriacetica]KNZ70957.1 heavy metal transport/detoxification protein [Thermincola ferriacetica]
MCECCANHAKKHEDHIHVQGVNCGHCVSAIEKALADMPGINGLEHLAEANQLKISFDTRLVDVAKLTEIITGLGYNVA